MDSDDEVRDRATLYYQLLSSGDKALTNQYILNNLQVFQIFQCYHYQVFTT